MNIRTRIALAAERLRQTGGCPQHVCLTKSDTLQLQSEMIAEGGDLAHAIMRDGIRKVMPEVHGLQIVWRSPSFEVV